MIVRLFLYNFIFIANNRVVGLSMKRKLILLFTAICIVSSCFFVGLNNQVYADTEKIYLGGMPAGFSLKTKGAYVVGLCDVVTEKGLVSPSKDSGVEIGDIILKIDGNEVNSAADVEKNIYKKHDVFVELKRKDETIIKTVEPAKDMSGESKLGVFIRDDVSGIGTVTYIKGNRFASLGHPVVNDFGELLNISSGEIYNCNITGYIKGERGKAGELRGVFLKSQSVGVIDKNLSCGVYGNISENFSKEQLKEIKIGTATPGNAQIYTTINGCEPKKYNITIVKVDDMEKDKNFVVKIEDKTLLDNLGGIVQGMSGSPIVQDNKLVGAITHVFINDPTRGFGVAISNMINN